MRLSVFIMMLFTFVAAPLGFAHAQCKLDTDCKGGRSCLSSGACGIPEQMSCSKDIDCPGDLICSLEKICHSPLVPATPAAVPKTASKMELREFDKSESPFKTKDDSQTHNRQVGFTIGARLAYGFPFGGTVDDLALDESLSGVLIPVFLEAGYRISERDAFLASFTYGPSSEICDDFDAETDAGVGVTVTQTNCKGSITRFGINWMRHVNVDEKFTPWVGLGMGYEWYSVTSNLRSSSNDNQGNRVSVDSEFEGQLKGFEFVNLQGGLDWVASQSMSFGPFAMVTLGRYAEHESKMSFPDGEAPTLEDKGVFGDSRKSLHEWFIVGIRASMN